jgi:uncharacterized repeat protein (TIGR01451 family)
VLSATVRNEQTDLEVSSRVTATFQGPDLRLTQNSPSTQITAGYPLTYNITLTNRGLMTATNIVITDTLPAATRFITASYPSTYDQSATPLWQVLLSQGED